MRISGYTDGVILSRDVQQSQSGNNICPWVIETEPGQNINISLSKNGDGSQSQLEPCQEIAVIKDGEEEHTFCGNGEHRNQMYISQTNKIVIEFNREGNLATSSFMLLFKGMYLGVC